MWLFRTQLPESEHELSPAIKQRLDELASRNREQIEAGVAGLKLQLDELAKVKRQLEEVVERMHAQEKGLKGLELDWQEWFDKFRLLYARLSKRIKDAAEAVGQADGNGPQSRQDAPGPTIGPRGGATPTRRNY